MSFFANATGLDGLFTAVAKANPDARALGLADGSQTLSFAQLRETIETLAIELLAAGLKPGDMVALVAPNSIEFALVFLAITWVRGTAAPLNPAYRQEEFEFFLDDQRPAMVLDLAGKKANGAARAAAEKLALPIGEIVWNDGRVELVAGPTPLGAAVPRTPVEPETDVALFLHTSGTTARPKGVPLTHRNLRASIRNIIQTYELDADDRSVLVMPLFHVHGLVAGLLAPLAAGAAVYLPASGKFSASTFWGDMMRCQATWYTAVPTIHQILLARYDGDYPRDNPPSLRFIRSSSAPLAPAVLDELERKFRAPVLEAYAMTEAAHQMAANPLPKSGPRKPGSVGIGHNVAIAILDDRLQSLEPLREGEVCVRGENLTPGYRNNPDANEAAFAGGWFHTGDLGYLDAEGYLFITGRIKDIINRGGEKIAPSRIDAVLLDHPAVSAAVAFGVPDAKYGEEVHCALVLKPGAQATPEEMTAFCLSKLSPFEIPKRFHFVDELPVTGSGKVQRKQVAEHFLAGP